MNALLRFHRYPILPQPNFYEAYDGMFFADKSHIEVAMPEAFSSTREVIVSELKEMGFASIGFGSNAQDSVLRFLTEQEMSDADRTALKAHKFPDQVYALTIGSDGVTIAALHTQGALYGLTTFGQIMLNEQAGAVPFVRIVDGPDIEKRVIAPTLAWYAGYARAGFGTQLWGGKLWKQFIDWCFRRKINALNVVMYGFWPFELPEYPETMLKGIKMKTWSKELGDWIEIEFTHPNLLENFLPELIQYANARGVEIYAYIGLNSYNGGYAVAHPESRTALSEELKAHGHVNNYDALCTSRPDVIEYLTTAIKRVESIGFHGLVFEESEETQWFCQCAECQSKYGDLPPNDAKHRVSVDLLRRYEQILNPETLIAVRWLREPPIVKDTEYLREWERLLPKRVQIFWAPGLEDDDQEFIKWVDIFGKDRIYSRNCEASGTAASVGRIPYLIPDTWPEEMKNFQFQHLWNDIDQFKGAVNYECKGITGYGFEWYGHEIFFAATAQYGWNCWGVENDEFLAYFTRHFYGNENGPVMERVIRTIPCIHETQICDTISNFVFMPVKYVSAEGRRYLEDCADAAKYAIDQMEALLHNAVLTQNEQWSIKTLLTMAERMLHTSWAGIYYNRYLEESARSRKDMKVLRELADKALYHAESDYLLIKENCFDSREHTWTGVPIGEYYIPSVIYEYRKLFAKTLGPDYAPQESVDRIYGGESLPWVWLLEWADKISSGKPKAAERKQTHSFQRT